MARPKSDTSTRPAMALNLTEQKTYRVGVLSDTHGHLHPRVVQRLEQVDLIIHAGDIDTPDVLPALTALAPVLAVRGNMDTGRWARHLNETETVQVGRAWIHTRHDVNRLDLDPAAVGIDVMIFGHTHRPHRSHRNGTLFINPGSTTFPRQPASASMVLLQIRDKQIEAGFIDLDRDRQSPTPV